MSLAPARRPDGRAWAARLMPDDLRLVGCRNAASGPGVLNPVDALDSEAPRTVGPEAVTTPIR